MRGSAAFRAAVAPGGVLAGPWVKNELWRRAKAVPSLDLRFADDKSLRDAASGQQLVTFTRASSGTFTGSDGVLRTATTNLLLRSEEFDNASWSKIALSATGNATTAPNGAVTADELIEDLTNTTHYVEQIISNSITGITYTYSVYVKAGQRSFCFLTASGTGTLVGVSVNLSTGIATSAVGSPTNISSSAVGNGWYRVGFSYASSTTGNVTHQIRTSTDGVWANRFYQGNGTGSVYAWGAQLEQSSTVGEYIPTTSTINSAPRFDHNPTTGESLGLLVEEQRTNSIRNNTGVGAVAGTPGTLPTNWSWNTTGGASSEVVGVGVEDGITYADVRLFGTAATAPSIQFEANTQIAASVGQSWTISFYCKLLSGTVTDPRLRIVERSAAGSYLAEGNFTFTPGAASTPLAQCRFSHLRPTANASTAFVVPAILFNGTGSIDFTLRIGLPQLEQGAFATSVIPTSTAAVTRSADVASITGNSFGTSRTNLLVRSEDFDNASWSKVNTTVTANSTVAPDGLTTADTITDSNDGSATAHSATTPSQSFTSGVAYTISVHAKAGTLGGTAFVFPASAFTSNLTARFNLTTGTVALADAGITASIIPLPNGWYRCIATATATATASSTIQIRAATTTGSFYQGNGTGTMFLWGAQLETGSSATAYIPTRSVFTSRASSGTYVGGDLVLRTATTNEARYDHDPATGGAKGLLLEAQATNLLLRSEDLATDWLFAGANTASNQTTAPDGATTADKLQELATTDRHISVPKNGSSYITSATTGTFSIYAKAAERQHLLMRFVNNPTSNDYVTRCFQLSGNGSVTASFTGSASAYTNVVAQISPAGNGWYRCSISASHPTNLYTLTVDLSDTATPSNLDTEGNYSYAGTSGSGLFLWGAQFETGTAPTSYIQTVASQVTRAADISTSTAATVFESSWYRQDQGSLFVSASAPQPSSGNRRIAFATDGTGNNRVGILFNSTNNPQLLLSASGTITASISSSVTATGFVQSAAGYALDDFAYATSGLLAGTDTSGAVPSTVDRLSIGSQDANDRINGTIRRLVYWGQRLPNSTLQAVTQ